MLISLALFSLPVAADSPWLVGELDATVTFYSEIDVSALPGAYIGWVEGLFYNVPQESALQQATLLSVSPKTYSMQADGFGNSYAKFRWYRPSGDLAYSMEWGVAVDRFKYAIVSPGPLGEAPPEGVARFLEPDNMTSWTPYMKAKAESLIEGSENRLDAVRRLSWWIASSVDYDFACWNLSMPAREVFERRIGVCDEFSNLFISMCRSVGIPARYVEGIVFNGETWNFHAWAEVYVDGWLPVDPTYDEAGFVDSSHIELAKVYGDSDVYHRIKWEGEGASVGFGEDELVVDVRNMVKTPMLALSADVTGSAAGGEVMNATLEVSNTQDTYIAVSCALTMPESMLLLDREEKSALLPPHGESAFTWKIAAPFGLDMQLLHTMPLKFTCFPGSETETSVVVDPRASKDAVFSAAVEDVTAVSEDLAFVTVRNTGTAKLGSLVISLCADGVCVERHAPHMLPGAAYGVPFDNMGIEPGAMLVASLSSFEFTAEPYEVSAQRPELSGPEGKKRPFEPAGAGDAGYGSLAFFLALMVFVCSIILSAAYVFKFR